MLQMWKLRQKGWEPESVPGGEGRGPNLHAKLSFYSLMSRTERPRELRRLPWSRGIVGAEGIWGPFQTQKMEFLGLRTYSQGGGSGVRGC